MKPLFRVAPQGECGIVVELGDAIDRAVHGRVIRFAAAIARELAGRIVEVVPAYASVLVVFDPLVVGRAVLVERLEALRAAADRVDPDPDPDPGSGRLVTVPVLYGGDAGPDLEFVASHNGLTPDEVVAIHSSTTYLVYMLGFTPGFPYLGGMSGRIATPRLETPRSRTPAGSVGIAGEQTGIYPVESPGGWRIIGRTPLRLFDPARDRPFLVAAGDRVRFEPITPGDRPRHGEGAP